MIRTLLGTLVLFLFAFVAAAGPEVPVGKTVYEPAPGDHFQTSVSTDGSGYLAIWRDGRTMSSTRLMAARVSAEGDVLDRLGLTIAEDMGEGRVTWTGAKYLVAWTAGATKAQVFGATVDRDGNVSAPQLFADDGLLLGIGSAGDRTIVLYQKEGEIRAVLLDREARPTGDVRILYAGPQRTGFAVTGNGRELLIAYGETSGADYHVHVLRVALDGTVIGNPRDMGEGYMPRLASDGTDYLLVFRRLHLAQFTWTARALSADLSSISGPSTLVESAAMELPSLLWNGSEYVFVAQQYPQTGDVSFRLSAVRIARNGRQLEDALEVDRIQQSSVDPGASAATNGTTILGAWVESNIGLNGAPETRVVARLYSARTLDALGNELLLSLAAVRQISPAVAFDQTGTALVIWREPRGVYATRISPAGKSLDGRGIELATSWHPSPPAVVFDGTQFVVGWIEGGTLQTRFITTGGEMLREWITIPNVQSFAMKNGFNGPMIAWTDSDSRLWATRIDRQTRQADAAPVAVSPEGMKTAEPALAWNGRETLVVWTEVVEGIWWHGPNYELLRIRGARLSSSFTVIDTAPLTIGDVADAWDQLPSVSSNGDDWLVTWINGPHLRANRVTRGGIVGGEPEGTVLATAVRAGEISAEVLFDRTNYAIAFKTDRVLRTGYVPATGPIFFNSLVTLGDTRSRQLDLSITRTGTTVVVAYARLSDAPEHGGIERAYIRSVESVRKSRAVR